MFKVVPDQLKISDGWVRCGHCSDVFDAMLNLQGEVQPAVAGSSALPTAPAPAPGSESRVVIRRVPVPAPQAPPPVAQAPAGMVAPPGGFTGDAPSSPYAFPPPQAPFAPAPPPAPVFAPPPAPAVDPGWDFASQFEEPEDETTASQLDGRAEDAWDGDWLLSPRSVSEHREAVEKELQNEAPSKKYLNPVSSNPVSEAFERELGLFASVGQAVDGPASVRTDPPALEAFGAPDSGLDPEENEPAFVVQGRRDAFWRSPAMRAVLWVSILVLGAILALQWAYQERDQLAARHPAVMPWLQSYCEVAGCRLTAPRRIDAVAIDSSTLVRRLGQFYAFDLVVKNSDAMPVAMPALELSLTNGRNEAIARRVFLPKEMPGSPSVVPANGSLAVNMRLSLSEAELGDMAGYRALVFYP